MHERRGQDAASDDVSAASRPNPRTQQAVLFAMVFVLLALNAKQPLLDHYVGRQIPTAMVARNLARGSGFLRPQLDTGPFPNLFLVEPPVYAAIVAGANRMTGLDLGACGRLVSALATAAAAVALFGMVRRREGWETAVATVFAFFFLPIVLNYGAAFQPDALMLGLVFSGMRLWDDHEAEGGGWRLALAWALVAAGLATRVLGAYLLIPLAFGIVRSRPMRTWALLLSTLLPALMWYAYAASLIRSGEGSRASADNAGLWRSALSLAALGRPRTYWNAARILGWSGFPPFAVALTAWGLWPRAGRSASSPLDAIDPPGSDDGRLWRIWALAATGSLLLLAGKSHHEYYWLALAPVVAVGMARGLPRLFLTLMKSRWKDEVAAWAPDEGATGPGGTIEHEEVRPLNRRVLENSRKIARVFVPLLCLVSWSMLFHRHKLLEIPPEWAAWEPAVAAIASEVPAGSLIAAPEAILYLADRRGCRLEYEPRSAVRAAGEWGGRIDPDDPLALVEFYRSKGARFVADLWPVAEEPNRRVLHDAIRRRYNVKVDRDGVLLAELVAEPAR